MKQTKKETHIKNPIIFHLIWLKAVMHPKSNPFIFLLIFPQIIWALMNYQLAYTKKCPSLTFITVLFHLYNIHIFIKESIRLCIFEPNIFIPRGDVKLFKLYSVKLINYPQSPCICLNRKIIPTTTASKKSYKFEQQQQKKILYYLSSPVVVRKPIDNQKREKNNKKKTASNRVRIVPTTAKCTYDPRKKKNIHMIKVINSCLIAH